uniref:Basic blue protein n=1 Tax=Anthurium amnicola TaxID=1678845 RepID=A0A1D1Y341_9ARAE
MGRGECGVGAVFLAFLLVTGSPGSAAPTTHVVGDSLGWGLSMSYSDWTNDKTFFAGDTLVFNYPTGMHDVVPVSMEGYRSCRPVGAGGRRSRVVGTTGSDKFALRKGDNYFICSIPGHCSAGMKIHVNAN